MNVLDDMIEFSGDREWRVFAMQSHRRFLITGAAGFLGRHFLAGLAQRRQSVRALVRRPPEESLPGEPESVVADLSESETLTPALAGITDVIHLAARVHKMRDTASEPLAEFWKVNVEGTRRLIEASAEAGVRRVLFVSSVKAMGEEETGTFDEESGCRPSTPYGRSKLEAERVVLNCSMELGVQATVIRLPMVYGPGNKGNMMRLLRAAAAGYRLPFGRLENRRSMIYVDNVVAAGLAALESDRSSGQVYLVGDAKPYSTRDLYEAICRAMGRKPLVFGVPPSWFEAVGRVGGLCEKLLRRQMPINPGVVRRLTGDLCFSTDKIRAELGFEPEIDLDEGIRRTVEWFEAEKVSPQGKV